MTIGVYCMVFGVLVVASTVQASSGFGQGLIAAPLLRLLHPELLPGPIVFLGLVTAATVAVRNSRRSDLPVVVPALGGRVVGTAIAIGLLATLSERGMSISIGVIVFGLVGLRVLGLRVPRSPRTLAGAGVVSGIGGTIAALGGAPMALLYEQHADARDFRGPMGWYTVLGSTMSLAMLALALQLDGDDVRNGAVLLPPVALGWLLARWVTPWLDRGHLRPVVLGLSATSALALILGELV